MNEFHFLRPAWFLALIPALLLLITAGITLRRNRLASNVALARRQKALKAARRKLQAAEAQTGGYVTDVEREGALVRLAGLAIGGGAVAVFVRIYPTFPAMAPMWAIVSSMAVSTRSSLTGMVNLIIHCPRIPSYRIQKPRTHPKRPRNRQ